MPWLTPESIPEGDLCRPLSIPDDTAWLALVSGALTELTKPYNWEQGGALTVAETVERMQALVDAYYASPCAMCITPGGYRVIRISITGQVEQLSPSGEWQPAADEYQIPAPEAREGGEPSDQICLAAKNAVNVLASLYENLSDSFNTDLDEAEAITAFILAATALVGFEFAPITWGIVAFLTPVFAALYSALEFLILDLWDEAVTNQITCFLVDCATNDAGVVTFDWDCLMNRLNSLLNQFSLSEEQLRLYLQIIYILYFIGGIDGLNLAARTTEVTDDDCSMCGEPGCESRLGGNGFDDWSVDYIGASSGGCYLSWEYDAGLDVVQNFEPCPANTGYAVAAMSRTFTFDPDFVALSYTFDPSLIGGQVLRLYKNGTEVNTFFLDIFNPHIHHLSDYGFVAGDEMAWTIEAAISGGTAPSPGGVQFTGITVCSEDP